MNKHRTKIYKREEIDTTFSIENVFSYFVDPKVGTRSKTIAVYSQKLNKYFDVYLNSERYQLFKLKGCKCVTCGFEATKCVLVPGENPTRAHFQFVGLDESGNEVVLTKDHIVPYSVGGTNNIDNYQPMCYPCNQAKQATCDVKLLETAEEKGQLVKLPTVTVKLNSIKLKQLHELFQQWIKLHDWDFTYDPELERYHIKCTSRSNVEYINSSVKDIKAILIKTQSHINNKKVCKK